jgi:hypothetical protein
MQRPHTTRHPSFLPLSRATVQMRGLEQTGHRAAGQRDARRPLHTFLRWVTTVLRH